MKGFLLSATAIIALALPAGAADMPQKAQQYGPPPVVKCSWCGFSLTAVGGWGWGETKPDITLPAGLTVPKQDGWVAGGEAYYRWQPGNGNFVFGLGLDYMWADMKETQTIGTTSGFKLHTQFEQLASARAMAGIAVGDSILLYGNAGLAFAKAKASVDVFSPVASATLATANENLWGYVIGGGVDFKLAPNIVVGADYSYYGFGKQSYEFVLTGSPIVLGVNANTDAHVARGKLGVRF